MHHLVNYSQIMSPVPLCLEKWGVMTPPAPMGAPPLQILGKIFTCNLHLFYAAPPYRRRTYKQLAQDCCVMAQQPNTKPRELSRSRVLPGTPYPLYHNSIIYKRRWDGSMSWPPDATVFVSGQPLFYTAAGFD